MEKLSVLGFSMNLVDVGDILLRDGSVVPFAKRKTMTDEQLEKQLNDKFWQKIASQSNYSKLKGQVNPLNPGDAGPIAYLLSEYRGGRLNLIGNYKLEE